jgi:enoyl-[acyl-carrier protein] reductase I
MKLLEGKKGLVFGLANDKSIAWGISEACHKHGAELGFTFLNPSLGKRVIPLAESLGSKVILECDVSNDKQLDNVFAEIGRRWGTIDFIVHSVAFANAEDLKERFVLTSRDGFRVALDISAYSLVALARRARSLMPAGGSILAMTYLGSRLVVPNYRLMGVAKAALEACVRELAVDLGPEGIRVNAISSGPIRTLAASGISDFKKLLGVFEKRAPLRRLTTLEDVGSAAVYLLSNFSSAITGEVQYVDCGFNVTAV